MYGYFRFSRFLCFFAVFLLFYICANYCIIGVSFSIIFGFVRRHFALLDWLLHTPVLGLTRKRIVKRIPCSRTHIILYRFVFFFVALFVSFDRMQCCQLRNVELCATTHTIIRLRMTAVQPMPRCFVQSSNIH